MAKVKEYVFIIDTNEKLEVLQKSPGIITVLNTKGQQFNIPTIYLETKEQHLAKKNKS